MNHDTTYNQNNETSKAIEPLPIPTRADLLEVHAALHDKDRSRSSAFLSFLAAYPTSQYTPEVAHGVMQDLQLLEGSELLEPHTLRRILEKVGVREGGAFALDSGALRSWEEHFAELSHSAT